MGSDLVSILTRILGVVVFILAIYCIRAVYKLFKKLFYAEIITTLPFDSDQPVEFELDESYRTYGVWLKGKWLKKAPVTHFKPIIVNCKTGETIHLRRTFLGANSNNMKNAYAQLFWFKADAGIYCLQKVCGSSLTSIGTIFSNSLIPTYSKQFELNSFSFELRKDLHPIYFVLLILFILGSFFSVFLGLFMFFGAETISEKLNLNI